MTNRMEQAIKAGCKVYAIIHPNGLQPVQLMISNVRGDSLKHLFYEDDAINTYYANVPDAVRAARAAGYTVTAAGSIWQCIK